MSGPRSSVPWPFRVPLGISAAHMVIVAQGLVDRLPQRLRHLLHFREVLVRLRKGMRGAGFEPANLYRTATSTLRR